MTTITPTAARTVPLTVTLTAPLHHGAGSSGNTSLLRTQEVILPSGEQARVPFVSANSVRHGLRDALAWHTVRTLDIDDGTLAKGVVDLLWSGGAVTATGAQIDLDIARRIDAIYPALGLLGYAAKSDIVAGTLRASDLILVCAENAWRLPESLRIDPRAAAFRTEEFGTRHDVGGTPVARLITAAQEVTSTQMIYEVQALKAGSTLHGEISLTPAATEGHRIALNAALALWAEGGTVRLGAKNSLGFGSGTLDAFEDRTAQLDQWTAHLIEHAADILDLLTEAAG